MSTPVKSLRDLFTGTPIRNPTLQELAAENPEHVVYADEHAEITARMPGDEEHPFANNAHNPFPEKSPLALARELRDGRIPPDQEMQVREYLRVYERLSGDTLYDPRNHVEPPPDIVRPYTGKL